MSDTGATVANDIAVVTGAGAGIGRAIARTLLGAGWRVALAGRRAEPLHETADGFEAALVVPADVGSPEPVEHLFAEVERAYGRVDLLVNNAGTFGPAGGVDEISYDDWRRVVDTNLTGAFLSARSPRPGSAAYTATKHAVTGLTKSLSLDGRPYDIACGQIDIGNAATEMTTGIAEGALQGMTRARTV